MGESVDDSTLNKKVDIANLPISKLINVVISRSQSLLEISRLAGNTKTN